MARWGDVAKWAGPTANQGGKLSRHDGVVVHIADGSYDGTIAWQRNPSAEVSSHFIVAKDGRISQMVDTDTIAWTQKAGNSAWLSVENEGRTGQKLTAAQVDANARILAKAHQAYGVPLVVTGSPSKRGLGHHSMGAESGVDWGHSQCPGEPIKAQKQAIVARAIQLVNGTPLEAPDMEQSEKLTAATGNPQRHVSDTLGDVQNLRNNLTLDPASPELIAPPHPNSPLAKLTAMAAGFPALVAAVSDLSGRDFTDEPAIIAGVLAGLDPAAIAAAIPAGLAQQVADELAARLQRPTS